MIYLPVPVIAIFTKFDALITMAFGTLRNKEKKSIKQAKQDAPEIAKRNLEADYVNLLLGVKYKPKASVYLTGGFGFALQGAPPHSSQSKTCRRKTRTAWH